MSKAYDIYDCEIEKAYLISNEGKSFSIKNLFQYIEYVEDIRAPMATCAMVLINGSTTKTLMNEAKITGGEFVILSFKYPTDKEYIHKRFIITDVNSTQNNPQSTLELISFSLTSIDEFFNKETRVTNTYEGTFSEIIEKVLKDFEKEKKKIKNKKVEELKRLSYFEIPKDIQKSSGLYKINCNNKTPFTFILKYINYAYIMKDKEPYFGYFLYENKKGLNFKHIDELANQKPKFSFSYSISMVDGIPLSERRFSIKNYRIENIDNSINKLFSSKLIECYPDLGFYLEREIPEEKNFKKYFTKLSNFNQETFKFKTESYVEPAFRFLFVSNKIDAVLDDPELSNITLGEIYAKSVIKKNLIFINRIFIELPGMSEITVGDVVSLFFPEKRHVKRKDDKNISGNYIVTKVIHRITKMKFETILECSRDYL